MIKLYLNLMRIGRDLDGADIVIEAVIFVLDPCLPGDEVFAAANHDGIIGLIKGI